MGKSKSIFYTVNKSIIFVKSKKDVPSYKGTSLSIRTQTLLSRLHTAAVLRVLLS